MSVKNISKLISLYYYTYFKKRLKKVKICKMSNNLATHKQIHSGPENLKSPGQKNSWNQIIQFHEKKFFDQIPFFCNFKNEQKSIFELGKNLKLPKMQFHEKKFWFIWFHEFFYLDFFKFSGLLWYALEWMLHTLVYSKSSYTYRE